jgi:phospholipase/carboxylesterase
MSETLQDYAVNTQNGQKPDYVVIFFHGYGDGGYRTADIIKNNLAAQLPNVKFRCPDGPTSLGWGSHSWFDVSDIMQHEDDKEYMKDRSGPRAAAAAVDINKYIDRVIKEEGIAEDRIIIAGYSQGGSMAYYAGLLRDRPVGGVYSLSGGALDRLTNPKSKPPVALVTGQFETGDYSGTPQATKAQGMLKQMGFNVIRTVIPNAGHILWTQTLAPMVDFIRIIEAARKAAPAQNTQRSAKRSGPGL